MLSKTQISKRMKRKTNKYLVETILQAKKLGLLELASALTSSNRQQAGVNLGKINDCKSNIAIIPGKVLSSGEIDKKIKVYAIGFSKTAEEKLKKAGCENDTILNALKNLKKGEKLGGKIIK